MSKVWLAVDDYEGTAVLVAADTRGQARASAASELNLSFKEVIDYVSVTRYPVLDDKGISPFEGLRYGAYQWFECTGCGKHISWDGAPDTGNLYANAGDQPFSEHGGWSLFCSVGCRIEWIEEWKVLNPAFIDRWLKQQECSATREEAQP